MYQQPLRLYEDGVFVILLCNACLKAWQLSGMVENYKIIRAGVAEWKTTNPVHLVCYFRYIRFFSSGRFLYKNSSEKIKDVVKFMNFRSSKTGSVFCGHYTLSDDKVEAVVLYPG